VNRTGFVVALRAEGGSLGPGGPRPDGLLELVDGSLLAVTGMGAGAAADGARRLAAAGCTALVSFGMAGGLDPALAAGTVLLPAQVRDAAGRMFQSSESWRSQVAQRLARAGLPVMDARLLSVAAPLAGVADKARAFARDATAVDMESFAVAEAAAGAGLAFLAVRVITDTARDELPRSVTVSLDARGETRLPRLLAALLRHPRDVVPLLALARRYGAARRALAAAAQAGLAKE